MRIKRLHSSCGVLLGRIVRNTSDSGHVPVGGRWGVIAPRLLLAVPDEAVKGLCSALEQTAQTNPAAQCVYDKQKSLFA
ncbi:MAG: hypothetical protein OEQ18_14875 [Gammaproteobacteria bacterium]|nr:hypothetical protein [Gammaproteobacteria bacterium]